MPMLVPLLYSEDAGSSSTWSPRCSTCRSSRHADGAVEAVAHTMGSGATYRAKENAAAAVLSLASVHSYRHSLGRNASVAEKLLHLARTGLMSTKMDALARSCR